MTSPFVHEIKTLFHVQIIKLSFFNKGMELYDTEGKLYFSKVKIMLYIHYKHHQIIRCQ